MTTGYSLSFRPSVEKDLRRLSPDALQRVLMHIESLINNPRPSGSLKLKGAQNTYRVRVGDYRIVYDLDEEERIVIVQYIRHRKDADK